MNKYVATVIKTGNSYALRVPKAYINDSGLQLGDKPDLPLVTARKPQDHIKIQRLWEELQALKPFKDIEDPVAWQRGIRKDRPMPGRD
ncbi:MAG: hypothetical protein AAB459_00090 [Patescibacteria group bacterium]